MLPYIITTIGAYLIGQSSGERFAFGGITNKRKEKYKVKVNGQDKELSKDEIYQVALNLQPDEVIEFEGNNRLLKESNTYTFKYNENTLKKIETETSNFENKLKSAITSIARSEKPKWNPYDSAQMAERDKMLDFIQDFMEKKYRIRDYRKQNKLRYSLSKKSPEDIKIIYDNYYKEAQSKIKPPKEVKPSNKPQFDIVGDFAEVSATWKKNKNVKETIKMFQDVLEDQKKENKYIGYYFTQREYQKIFDIPEHDYNRTKKQIELIKDLREISESNSKQTASVGSPLRIKDFIEVVNEYNKNHDVDAASKMFVSVLTKKYPDIDFKMSYMYPIFKINPRVMSNEEIALTVKIRDLADSVDKSGKTYIYKFKEKKYEKVPLVSPLKPEDFVEVKNLYDQNKAIEDVAQMFINTLKEKYPDIEFKMGFIYPIFNVNVRNISSRELALMESIRKLAKSIDKSNNKSYTYKFKQGGNL